MNSGDFENPSEGHEAMMRQQISDYSYKLKANNLIEMRSWNWFSNQTQSHFRFAFSSLIFEMVTDVFKPRCGLRQSSLFVVNTWCGLFSCHFCVIFWNRFNFWQQNEIGKKSIENCTEKKCAMFALMLENRKWHNWRKLEDRSGGVERTRWKKWKYSIICCIF